jgi:hypothetical protein
MEAQPTKTGRLRRDLAEISVLVLVTNIVLHVTGAI